jgi:hypothetical protein
MATSATPWVTILCYGCGERLLVSRASPEFWREPFFCKDCVPMISRFQEPLFPVVNSSPVYLRCLRCKRQLSDPVSRQRGYGETCAEKALYERVMGERVEDQRTTT